MLEYIRIGCAVPPVRIGSTEENVAEICRKIREAEERN